MLYNILFKNYKTNTYSSHNFGIEINQISYIFRGGGRGEYFQLDQRMEPLDGITIKNTYAVFFSSEDTLSVQKGHKTV